MLYCIATNPRVEQALVEELDAHGLLATPTNPSPEHCSYETLSQLPYLHAVVREAMRMLPVVAAVGREFDQDVCVEGYVLPRNVTIICSMYPAYINCWEDGETYKPERWLQGGVDASDANVHHPSKVGCLHACMMDAHMPGAGPAQGCLHGPWSAGTGSPPRAAGLPHGFTLSQVEQGSGRVTLGCGSQALFAVCRRCVVRWYAVSFSPSCVTGPRNCIGQSLAKVSVPTTIAYLVSRFHFELDPDFDADTLDFAAVTLKPKAGLPMRCVPRV